MGDPSDSDDTLLCTTAGTDGRMLVLLKILDLPGFRSEEFRGLLLPAAFDGIACDTATVAAAAPLSPVKRPAVLKNPVPGGLVSAERDPVELGDEGGEACGTLLRSLPVDKCRDTGAGLGTRFMALGLSSGV